MEGTIDKAKNYNRLIYIVGTVLAIAVGVIYITPKIDMSDTWMDYLPAVNATINGTVSLLLVLGLVFVKQGKIEAHKKTMMASILMSALFLLSYVTYHITHESTVFGGEGTIRYIYLFILLTHILFAMIIAPLVLITFTRALSERFDKHRKIARITWPLWFYVSITGVIVYIMISPYY
jgi:putative membrane protein